MASIIDSARSGRSSLFSCARRIDGSSCTIRGSPPRCRRFRLADERVRVAARHQARARAVHGRLPRDAPRCRRSRSRSNQCSRARSTPRSCLQTPPLESAKHGANERIEQSSSATRVEDQGVALVREDAQPFNASWSRTRSKLKQRLASSAPAPVRHGSGRGPRRSGTSWSGCDEFVCAQPMPHSAARDHFERGARHPGLVFRRFAH